MLIFLVPATTRKIGIRRIEPVPGVPDKRELKEITKIARRLGFIATRFGEYDGAQEHFELALEQCGQSYVVERALTCYQYSEMLIQRDDPGDGERATALQDEAIELCRKVGMKTLLELVLAQRKILKA